MDSNYLEIQRRINYSNKKFRIIFIIIFGLFLFSLIGILKLIIIWKIEKIEVMGNERISKEKIISDINKFISETNTKGNNLILRFLGQDNLLVWYYSDWNNFFKNNSSLASLSYSFNFLNRSVSFNIKERSP